MRQTALLKTEMNTTATAGNHGAPGANAARHGRGRQTHSHAGLACALTLITPTRDRGELLADAIASTGPGADPLLQHLIIDGGNDDLTCRVVSAHPRLEHLREPDRGVYDAFNKGIRAARGEVIGFLNSDDLLEEGALQAITQAFMENADIDVVSGGAVIESLADGALIRRFDAPSDKAISLENITFGAPIFNAHFFRRRVFERLGGFDPDLPLLADREFLLRVALAGLENRIIDRPVYRYRAHPGSLTFGGRARVFAGIGRERMSISERYLDSGRLDAASAGILRAWHSDGAAVELALRLRSAQWSALPGLLRRARRYNPGWRRALAGSISRKLLPAALRRRLPG